MTPIRFWMHTLTRRLDRCRTSYKKYRHCRCIYVGDDPSFCTTYASTSPESRYQGPFKPKLLTWTHEGLDFEFDGMDFMSADISNEAPKGLTCPTITAVPDDGPSVEKCPLCDSLQILELVQEMQSERQGLPTNSVGTSARRKSN